ncbi:D-arabinono-1,4-lactone oxidase [Humibacter sp. RRB41]|uniref:D-arabinono-1,4-lactone oxidase n=1 Tax=Humibacter sp. RRB41 TaxID=2919946 RepID=UPI001FAA1A7B|nr:D-arabinono-1,4-lactone oxidase [Humibacter sp. RRB41]
MTATGAKWRNWGRSQKIRPAHVERPKDTAAVQRAVSSAADRGLHVKPVGAGHSFSGIAVAPGVLLDLYELSGVVAVDEASGRVTLGAGTNLFRLPELLAPYGLALENMGDIDRQTIAGATSTGTHGTGGRFGGLATQIVAATLVIGDGSVLHVSETENAELLPAVRLGLGALGVLVDITVQCVPAFLLHAVEASEPREAVLDAYLDRSANEDHFEFYWFPHTDVAVTKTNTRLPIDEARHPRGRFSAWVEDELLANGAYRGICAIGSVVPAIVPPVNRLAGRLMGNGEFTDLSPRVFVTDRGVRFREMEYALPREAVPAALREVDALIRDRGWRISFPVEVRSAAADGNWMSTAHGRDTGYIAVHRYFREDPTEYFAAVEAIMRANEGRPHWGKMHTRTIEDLRPVYPRFDDFVAVRDRLDPAGVFENGYLRSVLGPVRVTAT